MNFANCSMRLPSEYFEFICYSNKSTRPRFFQPIWCWKFVQNTKKVNKCLPSLVKYSSFNWNPHKHLNNLSKTIYKEACTRQNNPIKSDDWHKHNKIDYIAVECFMWQWLAGLVLRRWLHPFWHMNGECQSVGVALWKGIPCESRTQPSKHKFNK